MTYAMLPNYGERVCECCHYPFTARSPHAKYCSMTCYRRAAHRRRARKPASDNWKPTIERQTERPIYEPPPLGSHGTQAELAPPPTLQPPAPFVSAMDAPINDHYGTADMRRAWQENKKLIITAPDKPIPQSNTEEKPSDENDDKEG